MTPEEKKAAAALAAASLVEPGMRLGLGSGTTVMPFVDALAEIGGLRGTASSVTTAARAEEAGVELEPLGGRYDLCVDGADQVAVATRDLVKGGGGAHVREKLVAMLSDRLVIVCDERKIVSRLRGPIPVAVLPFAAGLLEGEVCRPELDDNALVICDVSAGQIADPVAWDLDVSSRPGVVSTGIFPGTWVERVLVAGDDGVRELRRPGW
jgi:ribose 5-phosphate isomerase A